MIRHNLTQFAERMRKTAGAVEPATDRVLRAVAVVANQTLVLATPVDTGRARANWQVSIGEPITAELDDTNAQGAIERNKAVIATYEGEQRSLIIQNNLSYIGALNNGSSAQASANFVEKALQNAARAVSRSKVIR